MEKAMKFFTKKMVVLWAMLLVALMSTPSAMATPSDLEDIIATLSPATVVAALLALAGIVYGVLWVLNGIRKCTKFLNRS